MPSFLSHPAIQRITELTALPRHDGSDRSNQDRRSCSTSLALGDPILNVQKMFILDISLE